MYGYVPPAPPKEALSLIDQLLAWLNIWWNLAWSHSNSLGFADWLNIHLAVVLLTVVVAAWLFAFWRYWRLRAYYGKRQLVDYNPGTARISLRGELLRFTVRLLIPVAIIVALINPYLPGVPHWVPSGKRDYAICIADNRGMGAVDVPAQAADEAHGAKPGTAQFFHEAGSRMDLVRTVITHLLDTTLARTPVSLIAFQGGANVLVPLTDSSEWLKDTLDPKNRFGLRVGLSAAVGKGKVDGKVSTIAACLQAAREALKESKPDHEKFIIYFGNGDDISSEKWMAAEVQKLKEENIQGAIFGVGGAPVQIPIYTGDDEQFSGYYQFRDGKDALSGYNEANLVKLSQATGWSYLHLDPQHMPNADFFAQQLTDSKLEIGRWYIFDYPVELALALILLLGLGDTLAWGGKKLGLTRRNQRRWP